ncbi:MAG: HTTM domain-containing protein [Salibacteraceae bacterium]
MTNSNWISKWMEPQDSSPLVAWRIVFGLLIFLEGAGAIATGWVRRTLVEPDFTFSFLDFPWLQPLPGYGMYYYFGVMALFGLGVMLGYRYRIAIAGYTILWAGAYFMQKSHYNNHYYLLLLLLILMNLVPAHRSFSLDVQQGRVSKSLTCPKWCTGIFVAELAIVFFYAAVAKMYPDWLAGRPVEIWMSRRADWPIIGPILSSEFGKWSLVYGGLFYDLLVIPMLLWRPTRVFASLLSVFFHGFNSAVFHIGIFPYLMMGALVLFYPPNAVRKRFFPKRPEADLSLVEHPRKMPMVLSSFIAVWIMFQIALPLRHWLIEGDVHWTEEGHRLSWHMMTRSKSGRASFTVKNPDTGIVVRIRNSNYLTDDQQRAMATRPDCIWQYAQVLEAAWQDSGWAKVEVYTSSYASLNGRKMQRFIDPKVNLAAEEWVWFGHKDWVMPLLEDQEAFPDQ